jgi:hypothetical protein
VAAGDDTLRSLPFTISQRDGPRLPRERPGPATGQQESGIAASATRHTSILDSAYATEVLNLTAAA